VYQAEFLAAILLDDVQSVEELAWDDLMDMFMDVFRIFGTQAQADFMIRDVSHLELLMLSSKTDEQFDSFMARDPYMGDCAMVLGVVAYHNDLFRLGNQDAFAASFLADYIGPYQNLGPGTMRDTCYIRQAEQYDPQDPYYPDNVSMTDLLSCIQRPMVDRLQQTALDRVQGMILMWDEAPFATQLELCHNDEMRTGAVEMHVRHLTGYLPSNPLIYQGLDDIPDRFVDVALTFARTIGFQQAVEYLEQRLNRSQET
jgi:hypothetical protein